MSRIIKYRDVIDDVWNLVQQPDGFDSALLNEGFWIVPLDLYRSLTEELQSSTRIGFWIANDIELETIKGFLSSAPVIAVHFPVFSDGRGFSIARSLRDRYDYQGELRVIGYYIPDQLYYLSRCGFDAFALPADIQEADLQEMLERFEDFTEHYQAATDDPQPLFRRRA